MHALIVDDSRAMRAILGQMLRSFGYQVLEAEDGEDGLARLGESGAVALALVDWNMPRMNGLEFVREVRRRASHAPMRIVMVTTETELGRVSSALQAGADEYVMKPFTRDVIAQKLEMLGLAVA